MSNDPKHAQLADLKVSFFVGGNIEEWIALAKTLGFSLGFNSDVFEDASFAALPSDLSSGAHYLTGGFHPTGGQNERKGIVHWHLNWHEVPNGTPPADLVSKSEATGGYPLVLERLLNTWPTEREFEVEFRVSLNFPPESTPPRWAFLPPESASAEGQLVIDPQHKLTQSFEIRSWDIDPPLGVIRSLTLTRVKDGLSIALVSGGTRLLLSADMKEKLEAAAWNGLIQLFA